MIDITIKSDGKKIIRSVRHDGLTMNELGMAFLSLKNIERELLDIKFDNEVSISRDDE